MTNDQLLHYSYPVMWLRDRTELTNLNPIPKLRCQGAYNVAHSKLLFDVTIYGLWVNGSRLHVSSWARTGMS